MAAKKIDIKFDLDSKSVKIAGEDTMKLTQQVRLLKAELASGKYSQEEFDILSNKLDNVQERMEATKARSGDLLTSLQLIPGPIGDIAAKFNGAISVLQQFSKFSFADLQTQFRKTIDDIKDIGKSLLTNTGISAAYDLVNRKLAAGFVAVGVGEQAAAVGARAFAAALAATGIGLLVVALGSAVSMLMDFVSSTDDAAAAQARLQKELETTNKLLDMDLADAARRQKIRIAQMKRDGASEKEIRDQNLADLKENLRITEQALAENRATEAKVIRSGEGELKDVYAAQAALEEKQAQLIADIREKEINNETENNKDRDALRQKNLQEQQKANAEAQKNEQEAQRIRDEAAAIQLEAELSLLSAQDREQREREIRFENEKKKLKAAGITDLTTLEKEYAADQLAIVDKYNQERLDKEKTANEAITAAKKEQQQKQKEDQEAYFEDTMDLYEEESLALQQRLGQSQEYFRQQKELFDRQEADLKFSLERGLINQKQYTDAVNALAEQRAQVANLETQARLADLELIGNALNAFAQLAGENTKVGKALAIATTTIDTYVGAQKAYNSQMQLTPDSPIRAAIAAAAAVVAGLARVKAITQVKVPTPQPEKAAPAQGNPPIQVVARRSQGGFVFGNGGSITDSIPTLLSNGEFVMNSRSAQLFSPMLTAMNNMGNLPNTAMPQSVGNQSLVDVVNQTISSRPIRTYVTAQDMSNQQQFDRTIKSRSLI